MSLFATPLIKVSNDRSPIGEATSEIRRRKKTNGSPTLATVVAVFGDYSRHCGRGLKGKKHPQQKIIACTVSYGWLGGHMGYIATATRKSHNSATAV